MADELANKGERDRSHISLHRPVEVRFWTRHLGVQFAALEAAIAKVGNSATAVRKELAATSMIQRPAASDKPAAK